MKANQNKSLKIILISVLVLIILSGIAVGIYFALKNKQMRYYLVEISTNSNGLTLSSESQGLSPNSNIISRPVMVNVSNKSSSAFIRAKIVFSSDSEDNRVLSFINQLNFAIKETETYSGKGYSWQYYENDNSFYLVGSTNNLKTVQSNDNNYYFLDKLIVPHSIKQISTLNSDGENVQIGEDVNINIIFEAIQSIDILGNKAPTIENAREYFNNFAVFNENGFTSENGFITNYSGSAENLILPKFVGEDYIIGIKDNAFRSNNLKKVVVPGSYIYFNDNSFSACTNLNYVALKSETPIKLSTNTFTPNASLEIYVPSTSLSHIRQNYIALPYLNNFNSYTIVSTNKTSEIDSNAVAIYAPNITEFEGDFKNFSKLKILVAPNLTKINNEMFKNNTAIIECDTPNATNIGDNAFNGCTALIKASFSKKLSTIGERAFLGCSKIANINFIKNVNLISQEAFRGCSSITSVQLDNSDVTIGSGAFFACSNLKIIDINNLTKIDSYALSQCNNLRYIKINNLNNIDINSNCVDNSANALFVFTNEANKNNFTSNFSNFANKTILLNIQDNVLVKFEGNIKSLNISDFNMINKINEIGNNAFSNNTVLNSIIIPSSVKKLGDNFISGCNGLTSLTINSSIVPNFSNKTFEGAKQNLTLYVPEKSIDVYKKSLEHFNFTILSLN